MSLSFKQGVCMVVALGAAQTAMAVIVTPAALNGWSGAAYGGGSTSISTAFPRSGNGSAEITLPTDTAEVDWAYELAAPVLLASFVGASYDYWRDSASTNPAIQAPAYALWVDSDCNTATSGDQAYLVYEPYYQTSTNPPTDQWVSAAITPGSQVWQAGGGVGWTLQPLSAYMGGTATGGTTISGASCILGVVAFAGSGWAGAFHGAIDNVTLTTADGEIVNANFEVAPLAVSGGTVSVPTLGEWALGLMALGVAALGARRSRARAAKHSV